MTTSARTARAYVPFVVVWFAAAVLATALLAPAGEMTRPPGQFFGTAAAAGVSMGLFSAWFELSVLPAFVRRLSSGAALLFWTAFYVGVAVVVNAGMFVLLTSLGVGRPGAPGAGSFAGFVTTMAFWRIVGLYTVLSFAVNLVRQVRLMLGPGTLTALLLGRYRRPVAEERVFLFVDLTGSTGVAQRLGPAPFNDFKNDFFADVALAVVETRGRIYQYVGDEVVVTWVVRRGRVRGSAVEAFYRIEDHVAAGAARYERRYGAVPAFKAGVHVGPVVTAEIGYARKDIVHSGDAVNVTSRIEAQCHAHGARLLASEAALRLLGTPAGAAAEDVGTAEIRGRDGGVRLFRITRQAAT